MSAAVAAGEDPVPAKVDALRRSTRLAVAAQVMLANDVALLFIMMNKPSLLAAAGAFALVNGVLVGLALVPRRAPAPFLTEVRS